MRVIIKDKVLVKRLLNTFVLTVTFMHGDADAYTTEVALFPSYDTDILEEYMQLIVDCINEYPHGRGGSDNYDPAVIQKIEAYICPPADCTDLTGYEATFDSFELVFYDEIGAKFNCEVKA